MEPFTLFCTLCGAAALSRGIVKILDKLDQ